MAKEVEAPAPVAIMPDTRTPKKIRMDEQREARATEASKAKALKAAYYAARGDIVLLDIIAKTESFMAYHSKLAQDGVAYEPTGEIDKDGSRRMVTVRLKPEERVANLDKAGAQQEILDYIDRQLK